MNDNNITTKGNLWGFSVRPITNCPHIPDYTVDSKAADLYHKPCQSCGQTEENWLCLHCKEVYCSRYCKGHMKKHVADVPEHSVCVSYSDLSVWCYICDSYITHKDLEPIKRILYVSKFGQEPYQ